MTRVIDEFYISTEVEQDAVSQPERRAARGCRVDPVEIARHHDWMTHVLGAEGAHVLTAAQAQQRTLAAEPAEVA